MATANIDIRNLQVSGLIQTGQVIDLCNIHTDGVSDGYLVTHSGDAPLSLPSSLKGKVKAWSIGGKCVQDGTPTPQSPIPVGCVGDEFVWNQLVQNGDFASGTNWTTQSITATYADNKATLAMNATAWRLYQDNQFTSAQNHKYLLMCVAKSSIATTLKMEMSRGWTNATKALEADVETAVVLMITPTSATDTYNRIAIYTNATDVGTMVISKVMMVDLTLLCSKLSLSVPTTTAEAEALLASLGKDMSVYQPYTAGTSIYKVGVKGNSIKWNQLVQNGNMASISGWNMGGCTMSANDGILTITALSSMQSYMSLFTDLTPTANHHYYMSIEGKVSNSGTLSMNIYNGTSTNVSYVANEWKRQAVLCKVTSVSLARAQFAIGLGAIIPNVGDVAQFRNAQCVDLTLAFGAGNEPTTVADAERMLKACGYDMSKYQPYDAGSYTMQSSVSALIASPLRGIGNVTDLMDNTGAVTHRFGVVDLGSLTYNYDSVFNRFYCTLPGVKGTSGQYNLNLMCTGYKISTSIAHGNAYVLGTSLYLVNTDYSDAASFKTAMSGVMLVYELATPTTETATISGSLKTTKGTTILDVDGSVKGNVEATYLSSVRNPVTPLLGLGAPLMGAMPSDEEFNEEDM